MQRRGVRAVEGDGLEIRLGEMSGSLLDGRGDQRESVNRQVRHLHIGLLAVSPSLSSPVPILPRFTSLAPQTLPKMTERTGASVGESVSGVSALWRWALGVSCLLV